MTEWARTSVERRKRSLLTHPFFEFTRWSWASFQIHRSDGLSESTISIFFRRTDSPSKMRSQSAFRVRSGLLDTSRTLKGAGSAHYGRPTTSIRDICESAETRRSLEAEIHEGWLIAEPPPRYQGVDLLVLFSLCNFFAFSQTF